MSQGPSYRKPLPVHWLLLAPALVFVAAMIIVQRVEMFIRARRIQAGKPDDHVDLAAD